MSRLERRCIGTDATTNTPGLVNQGLADTVDRNHAASAPDNMPNDKGTPNDTLARSRYERLARTVSELMDKATQNERILRKFQQYELQLLAVSGMEALCDCLLGDSLHHFQLDAVELWLLDQDRQMRELIPAPPQHYLSAAKQCASGQSDSGRSFWRSADAFRGSVTVSAPRCSGRCAAFWRAGTAAVHSG